MKHNTGAYRELTKLERSAVMRFKKGVQKPGGLHNELLLVSPDLEP